MTSAQAARLKKAFLEAFAEYGNITTAAKSVGVGRRHAEDPDVEDRLPQLLVDFLHAMAALAHGACLGSRLRLARHLLNLDSAGHVATGSYKK